MSDGTAISWSDATWSPVTGCTKTSEGCTNCYIDRTPPFRMAHRKFGGNHIGATTGVKLHSERLHIPLKWRKPRRIFVCSLADLFQDEVPTAFIAEAFAVISLAPQHTFQVLTKRHGRLRSVLNSETFWDAVDVARVVRGHAPLPAGTRVLPNAWIGVSVESQKWADVRIPALLATPAAVRWISAEPLLGPLDISRWIGDAHGGSAASRGGGIRSGEVWRAADRQPGPNLAGGGSPGNPLDSGHQGHLLRAEASGEFGRQVSAGTGDVRRDAVPCDGAPAGLAAFRGIDPGRADDQSQERHLDGQSADQSGDRYILRATDARAARPSSRTGEPVRHTELDGEVDLGAGCGDSGAASGWRTAGVDREGLRRSDAADLSDRAGRASLSWVVAGGESGPKARPMHPQWVRDLRNQCVSAGVAFHFKQWGEWGPAPWSVKVCDPAIGWTGTAAELDAAKADAEARGATHAISLWADQYGWEPYKPSHKPWSLERTTLDETQHAPIRRWGKKAAGRELDGRTWDEYPTAREAVAA